MDYGIADKIQHLAKNSAGTCQSTCNDLLQYCPQGSRIVNASDVGSFHFHVRLPNGWIVDATWTQFFEGLTATAFAGPPHEFKALLAQTIASGYRISKTLFFITEGTAEEMYTKLWGAGDTA